MRAPDPGALQPEWLILRADPEPRRWWPSWLRPRPHLVRGEIAASACPRIPAGAAVSAYVRGAHRDGRLYLVRVSDVVWVGATPEAPGPRLVERRLPDERRPAERLTGEQLAEILGSAGPNIH
jgi:hypothetical protein